MAFNRDVVTAGVISRYLDIAEDKIKSSEPDEPLEGRALKAFIQPWAAFINDEVRRENGNPENAVFGLIYALVGIIGTTVENFALEGHASDARAAIALKISQMLNDREAEIHKVKVGHDA